MKFSFLIFFQISFYFFSPSIVISQSKSSIDTSVFRKWTSVDVPIISDNSKYAMYNVKNKPPGSKTLVLRSLNNGWRKEFINAKMWSFSDDNSKAFIVNSGDSLCTITLGNGNMVYISNVNTFKLLKQGEDEWLCYESIQDRVLTIENLNSGLQKKYNGVVNYIFNQGSDVLLLVSLSKSKKDYQVITWVDFTTNKSIEIWSGENASSFVFDRSSKQLAYVVNDKISGKSIWLYKIGSTQARMIADNGTKNLGDKYKITGIARNADFSFWGDELYIDLVESISIKPKSNNAMVDIWNYQDLKLQSRQLEDLNRPKHYTACVDLNKNEISILQLEDDGLFFLPKIWNNKAIAFSSSGDMYEAGWNERAMPSYYIVCTKDNKRKELNIRTLRYSSTGKFIVGKESDIEGNIFSYDINTGKYINLTSKIAGKGDMLFDCDFYRQNKQLEFAAWLKDDKGILIYDRHDIWLLDLNGKKSPINITNGFGQRHHVKFTLLKVYQDVNIDTNVVIVQAFNYFNKKAGFYEVKLDKCANPTKIQTDDCQFEVPNTSFNLSQIKSNQLKLLVKKESAKQSPNYFLTSDFKKFTEVTDVYPEREYCWFKSELHTWKSSDGRLLQGILYKPESIIPNKKYPIIIHYYQIMSNDLNNYKAPSAISDDINIPYFISKGYLVFEPDIYYKLGEAGECAKKSIISAVHYLSKFSYVDISRMGIQGHSFGGYETNYIITQTKLFKAAMSSSGLTDLVSGYNNLITSEISAQTMYEKGQLRIGKIFWERPDLYVKNSPVFYAHRVTTPLLIMNNYRDPQVRFFHGLEFFNALRRLGKRVWLLQYDNGEHSLFKKDDQIDFTIRMLQFYDHYLKDSACPRWMMYGIPAKLKGIDPGYDLVKERDNKTGKWLSPPDGGLLKEEERKKVNVLLNRKSIPFLME